MDFLISKDFKDGITHLLHSLPGGTLQGLSAQLVVGLANTTHVAGVTKELLDAAAAKLQASADAAKAPVSQPETASVTPAQ